MYTGPFLSQRVVSGNETTYTSGEHCWESNVTFSVAHVSTTVPRVLLFIALIHTPVRTIQVQLQRQLIP